MNDSALIFNECDNQQLLLASVNIHADNTVQTPTQADHCCYRYLVFPLIKLNWAQTWQFLHILCNPNTFSKISTTQLCMQFYISYMNPLDTKVIQHLLESLVFYQHLIDSFSSLWRKVLISLIVVPVWYPGKHMFLWHI